jgi:hypothetical protein
MRGSNRIKSSQVKWNRMELNLRSEWSERSIHNTHVPLFPLQPQLILSALFFQPISQFLVHVLGAVVAAALLFHQLLQLVVKGLPLVMIGPLLLRFGQQEQRCCCWWRLSRHSSRCSDEGACQTDNDTEEEKDDDGGCHEAMVEQREL